MDYDDAYWYIVLLFVFAFFWSVEFVHALGYLATAIGVASDMRCFFTCLPSG